MKYWLLLSVFLIFISCQKEDNTLEEQHRLVRCKVNGEDWTPLGDGTGSILNLGGSPFDLFYYNDTRNVELIIGNANKNHRFDLLCNFSVIDDSNELSKTSSPFRNFSLSDKCHDYNLDTSRINYIKVLELDSLNFIMTGEFEFQAINECEDTVSVTDGYFDLHYRF